MKVYSCKMTAFNFALSACLWLVIVDGARADDSLPAVSEFNGKVSYEGGNMNSSTGNNFDGSFTMPVGHSFGAQADALFSRIGNQSFYGGGGHLFWRDPEVGLFGISGGYLYRTGVNTFQVGTEGEYYLGPVTFGVFAGVGQINYYNSAPFIDTNPTRFIGRVSADYYPLKDLRVGGAYTYAYRESLFKIDAEYQTPIRGLALIGEGERGDYGFDQWLVGIRYYFGAKKSLIDRQRQDDPPGIMQQILHGLGLYSAEVNRKANDFAAANPGGGFLGGGGYGLIDQIFGDAGLFRR